MKSEQDILYRIFANLAISQRSICEYPEFSKRERKAVANKVIAWLEKEKGILEAMDEDEKDMIYKRVGNRDRIVQQAHWCWESEECLLWAIGLVDQIEIPYYSKNTRDLFAEIDRNTNLKPIVHNPVAMIDKYMKCDGMIDLILSKTKLRTRKEIEDEKNIAMIWFWRAIEGKNGVFEREPFQTIVNRAFDDPEIFEAAKNIPISEDGMDLLIGKKKKFISLNDESIKYAVACAGWRQKALEWILNDESWGNTTPDN